VFGQNSKIEEKTNIIKISPEKKIDICNAKTTLVSVNKQPNVVANVGSCDIVVLKN